MAGYVVSLFACMFLTRDRRPVWQRKYFATIMIATNASWKTKNMNNARANGLHVAMKFKAEKPCINYPPSFEQHQEPTSMPNISGKIKRIMK